jgi:hypothetical protein
MIIFTGGRTPWASDQLLARPLSKYRTSQTQNKHIHTPNIHALCGIRIHDPSLRASEDSSCLRPLGYCDWRSSNLASRKVGYIFSRFESILYSSGSFFVWTSIIKFVVVLSVFRKINMVIEEHDFLIMRSFYAVHVRSALQSPNVSHCSADKESILLHVQDNFVPICLQLRILFSTLFDICAV